MAGRIYVGDWGVTIRVSTGIDVTSSTSRKLKVSKPNGVQATWNATIETPGTAGIIYYTTVDGDLNVVGDYKVQAEVVFATGDLLGETAIFTVYDEWK
jgi:hypothetical protein